MEEFGRWNGQKIGSFDENNQIMFSPDFNNLNAK